MFFPLQSLRHAVESQLALHLILGRSSHRRRGGVGWDLPAWRQMDVGAGGCSRCSWRTGGFRGAARGAWLPDEAVKVMLGGDSGTDTSSWTPFKEEWLYPGFQQTKISGESTEPRGLVGSVSSCSWVIVLVPEKSRHKPELVRNGCPPLAVLMVPVCILWLFPEQTDALFF